MWLLWFLPCAIGNRIRGGWLMNYIKKVIPFWSTTPARIMISGIISIPVWFTHDWMQWLLFWIALFVGFTFWWSPWNLMKNPLRDSIILTLRGLLLTFSAGFIIGFYAFAFSGLLMGIVYFISYHLPLHYKQRDGYEWNGSDWGELFFGGILGLFMGINIYFL